MKQEKLAEVLDRRQQYVTEAATALDIEVELVRHRIVTDTCFEKAALLGWPQDRIIKAIYLQSDEHIWGFIFPEVGVEHPAKIDQRKTLPKLLGIPGKQARRYRNGLCPEGMEYGTCTPFIFDDSFSKQKPLSGLFVHVDSDLESKVVDISIGGFGEAAHRTSLHLPYKGISDILQYKFGDKIRKADLFEKV